MLDSGLAKSIELVSATHHCLPHFHPPVSETDFRESGLENVPFRPPNGLILSTFSYAPPASLLSSPAHLKGLGQARVQVEIVPDHSPGGMALPVQDCVADLLCYLDRNQRELLQYGHTADQPFQVPIGLHGNEGGAPALVLMQRKKRQQNLDGGKGPLRVEGQGREELFPPPRKHVLG